MSAFSRSRDLGVDRLDWSRRILSQHAAQRLELLVKNDHHFAALHRFNCVVQRFTFIEHNLTICFGCFVARRITKELRHCATIATTRVAVFANY
jgi:hypothetical protein